MAEEKGNRAKLRIGSIGKRPAVSRKTTTGLMGGGCLFKPCNVVIHNLLTG